MPDRTMTRVEWWVFWRKYRLAVRAGGKEPAGHPLLAERGDNRASAALWLASAARWRSAGRPAIARKRLAWAAEDRCPMGV